MISSLYDLSAMYLQGDQRSSTVAGKTFLLAFFDPVWKGEGYWGRERESRNMWTKFTTSGLLLPRAHAQGVKQSACLLLCCLSVVATIKSLVLDM